MYGDIETYVVKLVKFYQAENYHQKYWFRNKKEFFNEVSLSRLFLIRLMVLLLISAQAQ